MLNPSRQVVISVAGTAIVLLALGLATDVGLFGWSLAVLLGLYLVVAASPASSVSRHAEPDRPPDDGTARAEGVGELPRPRDVGLLEGGPGCSSPTTRSGNCRR
jgi:hypothetical protein